MYDGSEGAEQGHVQSEVSPCGPQTSDIWVKSNFSRSIPLYYAVSTAPHSNQPQASTLSSFRNGRCRQPPEPKSACSPSLWLQLILWLLPINASPKLQASQNRRPCSPHTDELCLPLECHLLLSIPHSVHPHLSESYVLQGQVQIGHFIYERHWLQHQTRFDPQSVIPTRQISRSSLEKSSLPQNC